MPNKQKLFETIGSALMVLVLIGLIAAAILPWYSAGGCSQAWFTTNCGVSQPINRTGNIGIIYNATYALDVAAAVLLAIAMIIFGLYVWGNRDSRCVPLHLVVVLIIAAAVITFTVGMPKVSTPSGGSTPPFFNSAANAAPAAGWYIAVIAGGLQLIVFILLWCAYM